MQMGHIVELLVAMAVAVVVVLVVVAAFDRKTRKGEASSAGSSPARKH